MWVAWPFKFSPVIIWTLYFKRTPIIQRRELIKRIMRTKHPVYM